MWRSVLLGVALAAVLAGCSLGADQQTASPRPTLVVRILRFGNHGNEKVVAEWRLGCNLANGDHDSFGFSGSGPGLTIPKPEAACRALRDYATLESPNRACSCVIPQQGQREATVTGLLDGKRVNAGLPYFACRCSVSARQVRDLQVVTGLK
jgi:hypothetical protein